QRRLQPLRQGGRPTGPPRPRRRFRQGREAASQALPDLQDTLHRAQSGAREGRPRPRRPHLRRRGPRAPLRHDQGQPRHPDRGPQGLRQVTARPRTSGFSTMSLKIALIGAKGRMGQAIIAAANEAGHSVVAPLDAGDNLASGIALADVIIDFSFHKVTAEVVALAVASGKPLVIGTTGHSPEEKQSLLAQAAGIPCVWSGNYSVGVNLLFALTRRASAILGEDYDAEVVEMHHRFKKDAP